MFTLNFDSIRPIFGGSLTQAQVDGINVILLAWNMYAGPDRDNRQMLAYALATTKWETAHTMQPIYERGSKPYFNKYEPGTAIGKRLGNTVKGDGYRFRGRGYVQLTGRRNYAEAGKKLSIDLVANPDKALEPATAARILVVGTVNGWFTGKGLNDYIDNVDESDAEDLREFVQARRVVNGTDKAEQIAQFAVVFENALKPVASKPPKKDWLSILIEFILSIFTRKKS